MPIRYRSEIKPRFHDWIAEGFTRYRHLPAMQASLRLTEQLMQFEPSHDFTTHHAIHGLMRQMHAHGIQPEQVWCRVCEHVAFMDAEPGRFRTPREERFALARAVVHLLPWTLYGKRYGAKVLQKLGELVQELLCGAALSFVRRLHADFATQGELKRQAMEFGK